MKLNYFSQREIFLFFSKVFKKIAIKKNIIGHLLCAGHRSSVTSMENNRQNLFQHFWVGGNKSSKQVDTHSNNMISDNGQCYGGAKAG